MDGVTSYKDPIALRNKARETMIAKRAIEEQKFNTWYQYLCNAPEDLVLSKLPFDYKNMTIQTEIPEWYVEVPDPKVCSEQVAKLNEKIKIVNDIYNELNEEGCRLLEEYNNLAK